MPATNALLQEGRYRINTEVPREGTGSLYEAYDTVSETNVVVKEISLKPGRVSSSSQRESQDAAFASQVKALTEVDHASILGVRDYFTEIGRHYLVMEAVDGDDLQALLDRQKSCFPVSDVTSWADQLLDALNFLHKYKTAIVHKSIRPANIKLCSDGKVKLVLSAVAPADSGSAGTIAYSPLEQIWSGLDAASQKVVISKYDEQSERILKEPLDARSDIYSLGAALYHVVTARTPIDALERSIEILEGNADPLLAPNKIDPAIPPEVSDVLMKAMEIRREYRFDSAAIMRQVLKTALVRVKEREAEAPAAEVKPVQSNVSTAQPGEDESMKRRLQEAEAQRLLAAQRSAEAEKRLNQTPPARPAQPVPTANLDDDLLGVLSPSLHVSEAPRSRVNPAETSLAELLDDIPESVVPEPRLDVRPVPKTVAPPKSAAKTVARKEPEAPAAVDNDLHVTSPAPEDANLFKSADVSIHKTSDAEVLESKPSTREPVNTDLTRIEEPVQPKAEPIAPEPAKPANTDKYDEYALSVEPEGSRFGVAAIAAGAVVILVIALAGWMFMSSGTPEPAKTQPSEVPAAAQPAQQDPPSATSAFAQPESSGVDPSASPETEISSPAPADSNPTAARISDAPAQKAKKPAAPKPAAPKKAVTVDDLINDN